MPRASQPGLKLYSNTSTRPVTGSGAWRCSVILTRRPYASPSTSFDVTGPMTSRTSPIKTNNDSSNAANGFAIRS
jgi:hypothetical protein